MIPTCYAYYKGTIYNAVVLLCQVIVLSHHPVGGGLRYYTEWETQVVVEYGDVILLHAQGHSHRDQFNVVSMI